MYIQHVGSWDITERRSDLRSSTSTSNFKQFYSLNTNILHKIKSTYHSLVFGLAPEVQTTTFLV
jgi:hypothetical protein